MAFRSVSRFRRHPLLQRVLTCGLAVAAGLLGAAALLTLSAGPVRLAWAAPLADTLTVTTSIQAAIDAALPGDTVYVPAGTYTESLTLGKAVSLTGELSATTIIHALDNQRVLTVTGASVDSSVVISGLMFTGGNLTDPETFGGGISIVDSAQPRLENVTVVDNHADSDGGGIYAYDGSALQLTNVAVLSNTVVYGLGGGMLSQDTLSIVGGIFRGNSCTLSCMGGGLFGNTAITLTSVQFIGNRAYDGGGGAIYAYNGRLIIENGLFQDNHCLGEPCVGGGVLAPYWGAHVMGTQFLSNTATSGSGGMYVSGPPSSIQGSRFQGNTCSLPTCDGGGLQSNSHVAITDTLFLNNAAQHSGGGVASQGDVSVAGGLFQGNACTQVNCEGGGLYGNSTTAFSGTQFISNTAEGVGGGLSLHAPTTLTDTDFIGNVAETDGGGGALGLTMTITGGRFEHNQGGGLSAVGALTITGTEFISNTNIAGQGGGLHAVGAASITGAHFEDNLANDGGGLIARGDLALLDTIFLSNTATGGGAGGAGVWQVSLATPTTVTVVSSLFQANACPQACTAGGLIARANFGLISDTNFIANEAYLGGGLYVEFGQGQVVGGHFEDNVANGAGGGLFAQSPLSVNGATFMSNTAGSFGGGGAYGLSHLSIQGSVFEGNACAGVGCAGGGLNAQGTLALSDTQFVTNTAQAQGGGVYATGALTATQGLFAANTCLQITCTGAGLYANAGVALTGTQFLNNAASAEGGGLYHRQGAGRLVNALFAGNSAGTAGDALAQAGGSVVVLHTTVASPTVSGGSAIAVLGGTLGLTNSVVASHTVGLVVTSGSAWQDYNLFAGVATPANGAVSGGAHSLSGAAGFRDPAAGDYRLSTASDAINAGINAGVTTDFEGDARPHGGQFDAGYDEAIVSVLLGISKTDGQVTVPMGGPLTYTIVISNAGLDPALSAVVSDVVPAGLSGATWTCQAGAGSSCPAAGTGDIGATVTITGGDQITFTLQATTTAGPTNTLVNTATVTALGSTLTASDQTIVAPQVAMGLTKTDGVTQVISGARLTYTLVVTNAGPHAAVGVLVTDTLPAALTGAAWTCQADGGSSCAASGLGSLSTTVTVTAGSRLTFTLSATATVGATAVITNTAGFALPLYTTNTLPGPQTASDTTLVVFLKKVYLPFVRR